MSDVPLSSNSKADIFYGITAIGRQVLKKHNEGKKLTYKQAVLAKCYECTCGYVDGRFDCRIQDCPLYPYMPYKGAEPKATDDD